MRIANVNVPQGLGDIWWCYQKLFDYFDEINLNILLNNPKSEIELRCQNLFQPLDKINKVTMKQASRLQIHNLCKSVIRLDDVFKKGQPDVAEFDYICNRWLELGNPLETLDANYHVNWEIPVPTQEIETFGGSPYIILYVSGDTRKLGKIVWSPEEWVQFITQFRQKLGVEWPVLMIGAGFDQWAISSVTKLMTAGGIPHKVILDLDIREICYVIKNAEYYIGYQSGLNILANHMDTKQLIVYFNSLSHMKDTWAKPQHRTNGVFNHVQFKDGIQSALALFG